MDADHLDVCGIYNMEFERLYADLCRLQSETNDLIKRIQRATPYDVVNEFGTKLQTLCEMLKYTLERLRESPHHPWRQTPTMQQLLARRQTTLDYHRAQYEGPQHVYVDGAEDETSARALAAERSLQLVDKSGCPHHKHHYTFSSRTSEMKTFSIGNDRSLSLTRVTLK